MQRQTVFHVGFNAALPRVVKGQLFLESALYTDASTFPNKWNIEYQSPNLIIETVPVVCSVHGDS